MKHIQIIHITEELIEVDELGTANVPSYVYKMWVKTPVIIKTTYRLRDVFYHNTPDVDAIYYHYHHEPADTDETVSL